MKGQKEVRVHGSDYLKPGSVNVFELGPDRVAATTPGRKQYIRKKDDGNEDALAQIPINQQVDLMLVADAHYGAFTANYVIDHFADLFREIKGSNPRRLFFSHLDLDAELRTAKERNGDHRIGSSTTLISLALKADVAAYCSTGDSRFFVLRDDQFQDVTDTHYDLFLGDGAKPINRFIRALREQGVIDELTSWDDIKDTLFQLTKIYKQVKANRVDPPSVKQIITEIGNKVGIPFPFDAGEVSQEWHPLNLEMGTLLPHWGSFTLKPGDVLFLATDGVEPECTGVSFEQISQILMKRDQNLTAQAAEILELCLGKKGGKDNLSFIIARV